MGQQLSAPSTSSGTYATLPFFPPYSDYTCMAVSSICAIISSLAFALRIFTKIKIIGKMKPDDWVMIVAYVFLMVYCGLVITGGDKIRQGPKKGVSSSDFTVTVNVLNAAEVFYITTVMVLKISIGLFFLSITGSQWLRRIIYATVTTSTLFSIAMIFFAIFQCGIYKNTWDFIIKRFTNHCVSDQAALGMTFTHGAVTIITDWTFLILPFFLLRDSLMNKKEKWGFGIILAFASISGIAAIARLPYIRLLAVPKSEIFAFIKNIAVFSAIEPAVGVSAGCLITLRPLFRKFFGERRSRRGYLDVNVPDLPSIPEYVEGEKLQQATTEHVYPKGEEFYTKAEISFPARTIARRSASPSDLEWQAIDDLPSPHFPGRLGVLTSPGQTSSFSTSMGSYSSKPQNPQRQMSKKSFYMETSIDDDVLDDHQMGWESKIDRSSWLSRASSARSEAHPPRSSSMVARNQDQDAEAYVDVRRRIQEPGLPLHVFEVVTEEDELDDASQNRRSGLS